MRFKTLLTSIIALALIITILPTQHGEAASSLAEIERKLKELENRQKQSQAELAKAKNRISTIARETRKAQEAINHLNKEIKKTIENIKAKEEEIEQTAEELRLTAEELDEAIQRVEERDGLLRARLRLMYTNGAVSYLDVLFSATSFGDFLDRFQSLSMIVDQDRSILEENIRDKNLIAEAKVQIETDLRNLELAYAELEEQKRSLQKQEREKEVLVAQLNSELQDLEEVTEEQEKALRDFATEKSKLLAEKRRLSSNGQFAWPLPKDYPITSNFGYRIHPIHKTRKLHTGTDIGAPRGTNVLAAADGVVLTAKFWGGYGNAVMIDHGNGYWTLYAHMSKISVKEDQYVKLGQKVGEVGSTGTSTGNHLHFEVRKNGEPVDPMKHTSRP